MNPEPQQRLQLIIFDWAKTAAKGEEEPAALWAKVGEWAVSNKCSELLPSSSDRNKFETEWAKLAPEVLRYLEGHKVDDPGPEDPLELYLRAEGALCQFLGRRFGLNSSAAGPVAACLRSAKPWQAIYGLVGLHKDAVEVAAPLEVLIGYLILELETRAQVGADRVLELAQQTFAVAEAQMARADRRPFLAAFHPADGERWVCGRSALILETVESPFEPGELKRKVDEAVRRWLQKPNRGPSNVAPEAVIKVAVTALEGARFAQTWSSPELLVPFYLVLERARQSVTPDEEKELLTAYPDLKIVYLPQRVGTSKEEPLNSDQYPYDHIFRQILERQEKSKPSP